MTGRERNSETTLDYVGARYYQSQMGRFTKPDDPFYADPSNPQTWNLYAYGLNNPLRFIDPMGHDPCPPITDTSTCVEGRAGTGQLTFDLVRWMLSSLFETYWSWRTTAPTLMGESPFGPPVGGAAERLVSLGAMRRLAFDEAVSASRHLPGIARAGAAAGPINGQAALDISVQVSGNSTRRVGIDYAARQFVVFDEHAAGIFHGHVRSWSEMTQAMQAALRRSGMVDGRGTILMGR